MTEPREPETMPDDGERTVPVETRDTAATWYPVDTGTAGEDAAVDPVVEAPVGETAPGEPVEEEPVTAEPVADEPVADEPETAEADTVEESAGAEPVGVEDVTPPDEEPAMEQDVTEEPVPPEPVDEPVEEEPVDEPVESSGEAVPVVDEPVTDEPGPDEPVEAPAEDEPLDQGPATEETVALGTPEPREQLRDDAEPTVATDASAEETVAIDSDEAPEATTVLPEEPVVVPLAAPAPPTDSIFRQPSPTSGPEFEGTRVEQLSDEEQKLAAERAARREARAAALAASAPVPLVAPEPVIVHKRTNDKFWGSLGLFLLRLVLAAILAVRGLNLLTDIPAAQALFATTIIPQPGIMAIVTGVAALLIALSLVLGLFTRIAGLGIALIGAGALTFFYWGNWSVFVPGRPGFLGDFELLFATVGVLLMCIGAGGWSLDRSIRAGRERNKAERASGQA